MIRRKKRPAINDVNDVLHISAQGTLLCQYYGTLRLRAYPDPRSELATALRDPRAAIGPHMDGNPWAIGWGTSGDDVHEGLEITAQEADDRFSRFMAEQVEPAVRHVVKVPLDQHQFDALVSFFSSCECTAMSHSILVRRLNRSDYEGAAEQFDRFNKSGGKVLRVLQRRREAERVVFLGMGAGPAIAMALRAFP